MLKKIAKTIYKIINSKKFFYVIIGFFIIQAAWFALTAQFPMAFDENYHFGLIQFFSHQWLPFVNKAPTSAAIFGEITRFDSYLYHYLMSFPYRLIALFVHNLVAQIIIFRFINIGLFVTGLFLFRHLFNRLNIAKWLINFSLLMLVLIPIVPFLATTISYDNLTFILVPLIAILALNCREEIVNHKRIPVTSLIFLLCVGALGSLVKYPFLPIFAATVIYLLVIFFRTSSKKVLFKTIASSFLSTKRWLQIILIISIVISGGLFIERYGVNLIQYHSLEPDCSQIQSVSYCSQFGPWARNQRIATEVLVNNTPYDPPIIIFTPYWFGYMAYRLYFAINYDYRSGLPLPIPITVASIICGVGLILCIAFRRYIFKIDRRLLLFVTIIVLYAGAVFYLNFTEFLHYRTMLAINGRYLVLIFPFVFILIGLAYQRLFNIWLKARARTVMAIFSVVTILLLLQGGGALTQLLRSQSSWYWQNKSVIDFNLNLKKIVSPFIFDVKSLQETT